MKVLFEVCESFAATSIQYWVIGGYGVELIVGQPIRPHDDIDFFVTLAHMNRAISVLKSLGFVEYAGSVTEGDVFYQRREVIVNLTPIDDGRDPPLTVGDLEGIVWPKGLLAPREVAHENFTYTTLTAEMHLEMKRVVADFFGSEPREKDLLDIERLKQLQKAVENA